MAPPPCSSPRGDHKSSIWKCIHYSDDEHHGPDGARGWDLWFTSESVAMATLDVAAIQIFPFGQDRLLLERDGQTDVKQRPSRSKGRRSYGADSEKYSKKAEILVWRHRRWPISVRHAANISGIDAKIHGKFHLTYLHSNQYLGWL